MRNDFERAVDFLLPTEPVKKGRKRDAATISSVGSGSTLATGKRGRGKGGKKKSFKISKGKTAVELRFHKWAKWDKLSEEQKAELISHREANRNYPDLGCVVECDS